MDQTSIFPRKCMNSRISLSARVGQVRSEEICRNCFMHEFIIIPRNLVLNIFYEWQLKDQSQGRLDESYSLEAWMLTLMLFLKVVWMLMGWQYWEFISIWVTEMKNYYIRVPYSLIIYKLVIFYAKKKYTALYIYIYIYIYIRYVKVFTIYCVQLNGPDSQYLYVMTI